MSENGATNDYFSLLYGVPVIGEEKREKSPPDFVAFNYATTCMFCGVLNDGLRRLVVYTLHDRELLILRDGID